MPLVRVTILCCPLPDALPGGCATAPGTCPVAERAGLSSRPRRRSRDGSFPGSSDLGVGIKIGCGDCHQGRRLRHLANRVQRQDATGRVAQNGQHSPVGITGADGVSVASGLGRPGKRRGADRNSLMALEILGSTSRIGLDSTVGLTSL